MTRATRSELHALALELGDTDSDRLLGWLDRGEVVDLNLWTLEDVPGRPAVLRLGHDVAPDRDVDIERDHVLSALDEDGAAAWWGSPSDRATAPAGGRTRRWGGLLRRRRPDPLHRRSTFSGCHGEAEVRELVLRAAEEGQPVGDGTVLVHDAGVATGLTRAGRVTQELTVHCVRTAEGLDVRTAYPSARGPAASALVARPTGEEQVAAVLDALDSGDRDYVIGWLGRGDRVQAGGWDVRSASGSPEVVLRAGRNPGRPVTTSRDELASALVVGCFVRSVAARGGDSVCPGLAPWGTTPEELRSLGVRMSTEPC